MRNGVSGGMIGGPDAHMAAAHVAVEHFAESVGCKSGLALERGGTMSNGEAELSVTINPDSGTGGLTGMAGSLEIDSSGGKHAYALFRRMP